MDAIAPDLEAAGLDHEEIDPVVVIGIAIVAVVVAEV
jgi:hypothetical protein